MIVPATPDHAVQIYHMLKQYFDECVTKCDYSIKWDMEQAALHIMSLLQSDSNMSFITSGGTGILLGRIGEMWFGKNPIAKPEALYVKPEHRNGLTARALLRAFDRAAQERGAQYILWEFETGLSDSQMLGGLMEKMGYEYQGPIYKKTFLKGERQCRK